MAVMQMVQLAHVFHTVCTVQMFSTGHYNRTEPHSCNSSCLQRTACC